MNYLFSALALLGGLVSVWVSVKVNAALSRERIKANRERIDGLENRIIEIERYIHNHNPKE